ncbi:hypothetical protein GCM10011339_42920 [Echinicola rosea]|uniref:Uncharacterized protein n=1 Tax=Echinicola rosea TaxID=1807691 RepID=A0ABQ1VC09_9BACT|nr:hypothetical protein GCM10011339_42920 [Echinicola rosea]
MLFIKKAAIVKSNIVISGNFKNTGRLLGFITSANHNQSRETGFYQRRYRKLDKVKTGIKKIEGVILFPSETIRIVGLKRSNYILIFLSL